MLVLGLFMLYASSYPHTLTPSHLPNLQDLANGERANYEQNVQDAMAVFPKLQTGLDVNVKFNRYEVYCIGEVRERVGRRGGGGRRD